MRTEAPKQANGKRRKKTHRKEWLFRQQHNSCEGRERMEQYILFDELEKKEARALALFRLFEDTAVSYHPAGYYLAFSGGKDSVVIYALAKMAGVRFRAHYHITTVDPPELVRFIRSSFPEVSMDAPEYSMWSLIVKKQIPPVRTARYCCEVLYDKLCVMESF